MSEAQAALRRHQSGEILIQPGKRRRDRHGHGARTLLRAWTPRDQGLLSALAFPGEILGATEAQAFARGLRPSDGRPLKTRFENEAALAGLTPKAQQHLWGLIVGDPQFQPITVEPLLPPGAQGLSDFVWIDFDSLVFEPRGVREPSFDFYDRRGNLLRLNLHGDRWFAELSRPGEDLSPAMFDLRRDPVVALEVATAIHRALLNGGHYGRHVDELEAFTSVSERRRQGPRASTAHDRDRQTAELIRETLSQEIANLKYALARIFDHAS